MDILVTHVYDKLRFTHYMRLKFRIHRATALALPNDINEGCHIKLTNLPECDVRYLQANVYECSHNRPQICDLKMLSMRQRKPNPITAYSDNEKQSFETKAEEMYNGTQLYSVTYTELVKRECEMTKQEIDKLLTNPSIKSININKQ